MSDTPKRRAISLAVSPDRMRYAPSLAPVLDIAREVGQVLPAASVVVQHIDRLMDRDQGGRDVSVLIELLEEAVR